MEDCKYTSRSLIDYIDDEMNQEQKKSFGEHLKNCDVCRSKIKNFQKYEKKFVESHRKYSISQDGQDNIILVGNNNKIVIPMNEDITPIDFDKKIKPPKLNPHIKYWIVCTCCILAICFVAFGQPFIIHFNSESSEKTETVSKKKWQIEIDTNPSAIRKTTEEPFNVNVGNGKKEIKEKKIPNELAKPSELQETKRKLNEATIILISSIKIGTKEVQIVANDNYVRNQGNSQRMQYLLEGKQINISLSDQPGNEGRIAFLIHDTKLVYTESGITITTVLNSGNIETINRGNFYIEIEGRTKKYRFKTSKRFGKDNKEIVFQSIPEDIEDKSVPNNFSIKWIRFIF